ncbi:MAG: amidohydrolase [Gemmatimonadales bacterium]
MSSRYSGVLVLLGLVLVLALGALMLPRTRGADVVLLNGRVWTGPGAPATGSLMPTAVAVEDGRITAVGWDEEIATRAGWGTRRIDLAGRMVVPGFMDAHTHFVGGGFELAGVQLRDAASEADFARRIGDYAAVHPDEWVTGGTWDHETWGGELPRRDWIDSLTGETPVFVSRLDGHMALANSKALELAGVTADTDDPEGGTIVRDADGQPTGVLKDAAMSLVYRVIPEPSEVELDRALQASIAHAVERGVTMITDMGGWSGHETYRRAYDRGELPIRVYSVVQIDGRERLAEYVADHGRGDDRLFWGGVKAFVDGSLGSTTAWFYAPYEDAPETTGLMVSDTAELRGAILAADAAELQVIVHAIGDRANDWLLDVFAEARDQHGERDRRSRIEHAQHLTAAAIQRFGDEGVIPSMQPYHAIDDGRWAEKRIGPERIRTTYAFRGLEDAGARLAFGSDWTVAPLDPLYGIYAAVTRRTTDGANPGGWVPEQKITVEEALAAYTANSAYACFMEDRLGTLEPGKYADLVVLEHSIFEIDPVAIEKLRVDLTMVGGEVVFER